eukprot:TRINITY_DN27867_c0_g1_i4.p1 TRINITY_DN27867_c0_g1~~TRINITY_DN27867_c0_g1_i4.p1  ORF type:complete len:459 (-),score=78.11 TRINITY_DN27867_c0_g1_i4:177-1553(-)
MEHPAVTPCWLAAPHPCRRRSLHWRITGMCGLLIATVIAVVSPRTPTHGFVWGFADDSEEVVAEVKFQCPFLRVVQREEGAFIQPLPVEMHRRRFVFVVSGGLLDVAGPADLKALFARELALLSSFHLRLPDTWLLWELITPPQKQLQQEQEGLSAWRPAAAAPKTPAFSEKAGNAARLVVKQLEELSRARYGYSLLMSNSYRLPKPVRSALERVDDHIPTVRRPVADIMDLLAVNDVHGGGVAFNLALHKASELDEATLKIRHLMNINSLADRAGLVDHKKPFKIEPGVWKKNLRRAYRVGLPHIESALTFMAGVRHAPEKLLHRKGPPPPPVEKAFRFVMSPEGRATLLALALAWSRKAEAEADKKASAFMGSIEPVARGLVILYGSDTEKRRVGRGEVKGLLQDCQAELSYENRWPHWLNAALAPSDKPLLQMRLADLQNWADTEKGQKRLAAKT